MTQPTIFLASSASGLEITREFARQLEPSAAVTIWSEAFAPGKAILESLTEIAGRSDFAIFILTAQDAGTSVNLPGANIIFELGFLAGHLGLSRVFLVVVNPGEASLPSDLAGIMYLPLAKRRDANLQAAVAPAVAAIQKVVAQAGSRVDRTSEFFSCFISYSWNDQAFAARLYDDLQKVGVRCWLDAKEMRVGEFLRDQIDRAIQAHDKVLLVLSKSSVGSPWVRQEIKNASALERRRKRTVLFPVRLDDSVLSVEDQEEINLVNQRFIIDFSRWKEGTQYQRAFSHLVRDLTISAAVESRGDR